jgi:endonuclease G
MTIITRTIFALALAFSSAAAMAVDENCDKLVPYGYPQLAHGDSQPTTPLCRIAYTVLHDNTKKVPLYSAELLLIENIPVKIKRVNAFKADPDLAPEDRADLADYDHRYDRGHMTPFEDARKSSAAALQTFYLSNMVPQNLHLNRGLWRRLENKTRSWAKHSKAGVFVITGPIFANSPVKTIGEGVAVPTHIYKVVIDRFSNQGIGFIIPNAEPVAGAELRSYAVTIAKVQDATGLIFTPNLRNAQFINRIGVEFDLD